jgi:hypothetical protein
MKNKFLAFGFGLGLAFIAGLSTAAVFPLRIVVDGNGRIPLENNLCASNGITVNTNFVLHAFDGVGHWRIVVTNLTGGIGVITNSGSN